MNVETVGGTVVSSHNLGRDICLATLIPGYTRSNAYVCTASTHVGCCEEVPCGQHVLSAKKRLHTDECKVCGLALTMRLPKNRS